LDVIDSDEETFERYKKAFNRKDDTEVRGLCSYLCAYVARHNLLANKDTFSGKFFDLCTLKEIKEARKRLKELEESLIDDLMNEAQIDLKYYIDGASQNLEAAF